MINEHNDPNLAETPHYKEKQTILPHSLSAEHHIEKKPQTPVKRTHDGKPKKEKDKKDLFIAPSDASDTNNITSSSEKLKLEEAKIDMRKLIIKHKSHKSSSKSASRSRSSSKSKMHSSSSSSSHHKKDKHKLSSSTSGSGHHRSHSSKSSNKSSSSTSSSKHHRGESRKSSSNHISSSTSTAVAQEKPKSNNVNDTNVETAPEAKITTTAIAPALEPITNENLIEIIPIQLMTTLELIAPPPLPLYDIKPPLPPPELPIEVPPPPPAEFEPNSKIDLPSVQLVTPPAINYTPTAPSIPPNSSSQPITPKTKKSSNSGGAGNNKTADLLGSIMASMESTPTSRSSSTF